MNIKKILNCNNLFLQPLEIELMFDLLTELGICCKCGKTAVFAFINFRETDTAGFKITYNERYSAAGGLPLQFAIDDDYSKQKKEYLEKIISMQLTPFIKRQRQTESFEITILIESISADCPASTLAMNAVNMLCYFCGIITIPYVALNMNIYDEQSILINHKKNMEALAEIGICITNNGQISFFKLSKKSKFKNWLQLIEKNINSAAEFFDFIEQLKNEALNYLTEKKRLDKNVLFENEMLEKKTYISAAAIPIESSIFIIKNENTAVCKFNGVYSNAIVSITEMPNPKIESLNSSNVYHKLSARASTTNIEKFYKNIISASSVRALKLYTVVNRQNFLNNDFSDNKIKADYFSAQFIENILNTIINGEQLKNLKAAFRIVCEYCEVSDINEIVAASINAVNIMNYYQISTKLAGLINSDFYCKFYYYDELGEIIEYAGVNDYKFSSLCVMNDKNINYFMFSSVDSCLDFNKFAKLIENTVDGISQSKKKSLEQLKKNADSDVFKKTNKLNISYTNL